MVVKTNRGIYEVTSVDIICEKRVPFNGQVVRLVQKANNIADASALKLNLGVSALELPYAEDSIFVGNLLITVSSFMIVAILNMFLKRHLRSNLFNNILMLILSIILYEVFILLLLFVVGYKSFEFSMLLYKITHSLLLNTIYIVIMFLVLKPKKA